MIQLNNTNSDNRSLPEFKEWSLPAVRLLQGVFYSDEESLWEILLRSQSPLETFFARLGLVLVIDESEGLAYLRQLTEEETPEDYHQIPKLFRKTRLGYDVTLLCVMLRDILQRFEEEDLDNDRCVVDGDALLDSWKNFFSKDEDEVRLKKSLDKAFRKLEDLRFVKRFGDEGNAWEVRRILKARLPVEELERLRSELIALGEAPAERESGDATDG